MYGKSSYGKKSTKKKPMKEGKKKKSLMMKNKSYVDTPPLQPPDILE